METLISFVVPVYNIEKYIGTCVDSLLALKTTQIEIILVNDGSSDNSGNLCNQYAQKDPRVKVIHQPNSGVAVARNSGIAKACGKWICLVDGDDWISSSLFEQLSPYLDSAYDILFFGYQYVSPTKTTLFSKKERIVELDKNDFHQLQIGIFNTVAVDAKYSNIPYLTPWGKLFSSSFLQKNRLKYSVGVKKGQDGLFNIAAFDCASRGLYVNETLYNYRINADSICHRYNPDIKPILDNLIEKYSYFIAENSYPALLANFDIMKLRQLMYCIILDYCHRDNPASYTARKKAFTETAMSETYKNVFAHISLHNLRPQEQVLAILIKYKMFFFINVLNKLRTKGDL